MSINIPSIKDIEVNRWYVCLIGVSEELCKVTRGLIIDQATGSKVFCWKVVCYYTGKDMYVGQLGECRQWLLNHLQLIRRK